MMAWKVDFRVEDVKNDDEQLIQPAL
jgi:hypothetical protein